METPRFAGFTIHHSLFTTHPSSRRAVGINCVLFYPQIPQIRKIF